MVIVEDPIDYDENGAPIYSADAAESAQFEPPTVLKGHENACGGECACGGHGHHHGQCDHLHESTEMLQVRKVKRGIDTFRVDEGVYFFNKDVTQAPGCCAATTAVS